LENKRIGLSLSGGGARAFAHLGVLKVLEEQKIEISCISGTSMGAIIGAFWAKGYPSEEILQILKKIRFRKFLQWNWSKGILSSQKIYNFLKQYFPENSFKSLKMPLYVSCTDMKESKTVCFSSGKLIEPLVGSISVPGLMMPFNLKHYQLADGGMLENLPSGVLKGKCDYLIGVHSNPANKKNIKTLRQSLEKAFLITIANNTHHSKEICDLLIEPPKLSHYRFSDFKKATQLYEEGYLYSKKLLNNFVL
jgi:NTE family protein